VATKQAPPEWLLAKSPRPVISADRSGVFSALPSWAAALSVCSTTHAVFIPRRCLSSPAAAIRRFCTRKVVRLQCPAVPPGAPTTEHVPRRRDLIARITYRDFASRPDQAEAPKSRRRKPAIENIEAQLGRCRRAQVTAQPRRLDQGQTGPSLVVRAAAGERYQPP